MKRIGTLAFVIMFLLFSNNSFGQEENIKNLTSNNLLGEYRHYLGFNDFYSLNLNKDSTFTGFYGTYSCDDSYSEEIQLKGTFQINQGIIKLNSDTVFSTVSIFDKISTSYNLDSIPFPFKASYVIAKSKNTNWLFENRDNLNNPIFSFISKIKSSKKEKIEKIFYRNKLINQKESKTIDRYKDIRFLSDKWNNFLLNALMESD
jgi:hypothetical protein